jgi:hypothetical protein
MARRDRLTAVLRTERLGNRLLNRPEKLFDIDRFAKDPQVLTARGLSRRFVAGKRANQDGRQLWLFRAESFQQLDPVQSGHFEIEQAQIKPAITSIAAGERPFQSDFATRSRFDLVSDVAKNIGQVSHDILIIVND